MANKHARWTAAEDYWLWKCRNASIVTLAELSKRTQTAIAYRLQNLRDPKHKSHQRLKIKPKQLRCEISHGSFKNHNFDVQALNINRGATWYIEDDVCLQKNNDCCYDDLAAHHGRTLTSIRSRMLQLADPNSTVSQRLLNPKKIKKGQIKKGPRWTLDDDIKLWSYRNCSTKQLAKYFTRSNGAIKARLEHLRDPKHEAKIRLVAHKRKRSSENDDDDDDIKEPDAKRRKLNSAQPPNEFCDPITYQLMDEPTLVTLSGYTYEKKTIIDCIKNHGRDPFTNIDINEGHLVLNRALKESISRWKREHTIQPHHSFALKKRKAKEEERQKKEAFDSLLKRRAQRQ